jgi:hypothetical protein
LKISKELRILALFIFTIAFWLYIARIEKADSGVELGS